MIKELRLSNWKSFEEAILFIDPLTILIGSNASGKSNTLDALLFLNRTSLGINIYQSIIGDVNLTPLRGGAEWICRKPEKRFTLVIVTGGASEQQDLRYELTVQVNGTKAEVFEETLIAINHRLRAGTPIEKKLFYTKQEEASTPGIPTYFYTGTQGRGKRLDLNRSVSILSQVEALNLRKEVIDAARILLGQLQGIFVFDPIPSHMRDFTALSDKLQSDGANMAGVLAGLEDGRKTKVEAALAKHLKDLPEKDIKRIWAEPVGKFKTDAMLYCEEEWGVGQTHEVDARGMSDGTLRYLSIVTALLTQKQNSLLVVEEVDNGLHPSRAQILVKMLQELGKARSIDVIITTHNPALLDAAGPAMVPFIVVAHRAPKTGLSKLTQLEDIQELPKLMAGGTLGRLSTEGRIESVLKRKAFE